MYAENIETYILAKFLYDSAQEKLPWPEEEDDNAFTSKNNRPSLSCLRKMMVTYNDSKDYGKHYEKLNRINYNLGDMFIEFSFKEEA